MIKMKTLEEETPPVGVLILAKIGNCWHLCRVDHYGEYNFLEIDGIDDTPDYTGLYGYDGIECWCLFDEIEKRLETPVIEAGTK